jgi:hypothetical protein
VQGFTRNIAAAEQFAVVGDGSFGGSFGWGICVADAVTAAFTVAMANTVAAASAAAVAAAAAAVTNAAAATNAEPTSGRTAAAIAAASHVAESDVVVHGHIVHEVHLDFDLQVEILHMSSGVADDPVSIAACTDASTLARLLHSDAGCLAN